MSKDSLYSVIDQILSVGFAFIFIIVVAQYLGAKNLGLYQFCISLVALVSVVTNFGVSAVANREVAKSKSKLTLYLGSAISIRLFISLPFTIVCLLPIMWALGREIDTNTLIFLIAFYSWLLSLVVMINGVLISLHLIKQVLKVNLIYKLLGLFTTIFILKSGFSLAVLVIALMGVVAIGAIIQLTYIHSIEPGFKLNCNKKFGKIFIVKSMPLMFISLAELISLRIDSVFLGVLTSTVEVGLYHAVYNIYIAAVLVPLAITRIFFPRFVSLFSSENDKYRAYDLLKLIRLLFIIYSFLTMSVLLMFGESIILLVFGEEFIGAGGALYVLALGIVFIVINRLYNYVLIGMNEDKFYLKVSILGALVNIILNLILIPIYSLVGAAIATIITEAFVSFLAHVKIKSSLNSLANA